MSTSCVNIQSQLSPGTLIDLPRRLRTGPPIHGGLRRQWRKSKDTSPPSAPACLSSGTDLRVNKTVVGVRQMEWGYCRTGLRAVGYLLSGTDRQDEGSDTLTALAHVGVVNRRRQMLAWEHRLFFSCGRVKKNLRGILLSVARAFWGRNLSCHREWEFRIGLYRRHSPWLGLA